jgi:serine/threonine protein kinase
VARTGPLPLAAVRTLGAALAEGLAAIHRCGLVHRDPKPANVLLAADGPRVIDFGIAKALDLASGTVTGTVMGTPAYMSPEQAWGGDIGPASDVFSLGSVLAFAASGVCPFGPGSVPAVINQLVNASADLSGVPAALRGLIQDCLVKDPAGRPSLSDILTRLSSSSSPAVTIGDWWPAQVTAMISELVASKDTVGLGEPSFDAQEHLPAQGGEMSAKEIVDMGIQQAGKGDLDDARRWYGRAIATGHPDQGPRAMVEFGILEADHGSGDQGQIEARRW